MTGVPTNENDTPINEYILICICVFRARCQTTETSESRSSSTLNQTIGMGQNKHVLCLRTECVDPGHPFLRCIWREGSRQRYMCVCVPSLNSQVNWDWMQNKYTIAVYLSAALYGLKVRFQCLHGRNCGKSRVLLSN